MGIGKGGHSGFVVNVPGFGWLVAIVLAAAGNDVVLAVFAVAVFAPVPVAAVAAGIADVVAPTVVAVLQEIFVVLVSKCVISRKFSPAPPAARLTLFPAPPVSVQSSCREQAAAAEAVVGC